VLRTATVAVALIGVVASPAGRAETLDELLESRALEGVVHPIAAEFLAAEGASHLPEDQKTQATAQLKVGLQRQTSPMALMMRGVGGVMNTPSMQRMRESAAGGMGGLGGAGGLIRSSLGLGGAGNMPQIDPDQAQREMQQAMSEPWVRGIGAARALSALGDAQAAARFYVACLQMLEAEWAPGACLEDIIGLGPRRAQVLLAWMLENAETTSFLGMGIDPAAIDPDAEQRRGDDGPAPSTVQLRNAALEGLGALIGSGALPAETREQAFADLMRYSTGRDNEPYLQGVAEGLARSGDPRAVEHLEKLSERRGLPDVRQAALRGLAVGFADESAIAKLRRELNDSDTEMQLRAAQALYETADEAAFEWATEVITRRRTTDTKRPDIRAQVVRDLVELGGDSSLRALQQTLVEGTRNDWLEAWVAVGLMELGDLSAAPRVEAALTIDDWELDPRGLRSIWRAIKPWLAYATQIAMSGGLGAVSSSDQLRQVTSLVGNAVASERGRHLQKLDQRESLTAQLRWQAADAIAEGRPEGALRMLSALLADSTPGVHSSAALALARIDDAEALALIASAYETALDPESSLGHGPELRATLVRSAVLNSPTAAVTTELLARASADPDPSVRFIALTASLPTQAP
jgi:HEAT repeat protein